ncbi:MAG TPA: hypothetical protein PKV33_00785 [Methanothrix sp.]|nr:hypothetical protein [Methanothrix sp.]
MNKYIKGLIAVNLFILLVSCIYGDFGLFALMLLIQSFVIACAKILSQEFDADDQLTIEPIDDENFHPSPESINSSQEMEVTPIQTTTPSLGTAIKVNSRGFNIIGPYDAIPDEVCCSVCGKNISQTRYEFGGVLICSRQDCGYWYHKNHFYDTAKGKCISPKCRER